MTTKLVDSLRLAFRRFLWGALGLWSTMGPIVLWSSSGSANWGLTAVLIILLLLCYAVVLRICLRANWAALKKIVSETKVAFCFIIIGLLVNEMTGVFLSIKQEMTILYAFIGFFIAEFIKPKAPLKALRDLLASRFRDRMPFRH